MDFERRYSHEFAAHRSLGVNIETRSGKPVIIGYAAVFYDPNDKGTEYPMFSDLVERIAPAAFDRAMKEDDCRALFNHNPELILGRTTSGTCKRSKDAKGLRDEITPPDTQAGRDVVESIRRGDITGSSFGFRPVKTTWKEEKTDKGVLDIRVLDEVQLFDIGPVTFPAYPATTTGTRNADNLRLEQQARRLSVTAAQSRSKFLDLLGKEIGNDRRAEPRQSPRYCAQDGPAEEKRRYLDLLAKEVYG